ncbi:hypothetical protein GV791_14815 [Nocardia cyriacigeorgica]|uniref:Uncharacterized protein n=1 Tax=Nocardia cyriacigeorgica TaxID=135487 RepID=A0A6P1CPJ8_9NOCA|nr:hypothetical protein [Nocardia cyriacigeorgica]NEW33827.1 hypothetical protein [Nocardia cyriacigeorgica]
MDLLHAIARILLCHPHWHTRTALRDTDRSVAVVIARLARLIRRITGKGSRFAVGGQIRGPQSDDDSVPVLLSGCTFGFNVDPSVDVEDVLRHLDTRRPNHLR